MAARSLSQRYDAIVIGTGQGGNPLAVGLGQAGWKTAVIERSHVMSAALASIGGARQRRPYWLGPQEIEVATNDGWQT